MTEKDILKVLIDSSKELRSRAPDSMTVDEENHLFTLASSLDKVTIAITKTPFYLDVMTNSEYKQIMKEAKAEFKLWLKDAKAARALIKKEAAKIRKATLTARAKAKVKKKVVKKKVAKKVIKKKSPKKVVKKKATRKK